MTPRTASLRVAHQGDCPNKKRTALDSTGRANGCTCAPSYYTFHRLPSGKTKKSPRVKTKSEALKALHAVQVEIDQGRAGTAKAKDVTFGQWADEYQAIVEGSVRRAELKRRTLQAYMETLTLARLKFADVPLHEIGPPELREFHGMLEGQKPASQLRHFRQLSACFSKAVAEGVNDPRRRFPAVNPVPAFMKTLKLRAPKRGKAPFEDGELERLWNAYRAYEDVYGFVCRFSVETGARLGEVVALDWRNVDLLNDRVLIEFTWDDEVGHVPPKDREARTVHLTPFAKVVLEEWVGVVGARTDGPVFAHPLTGGRLNPRLVQRRLETAMEDAGVAKLHPELRLPRSFHSFRYTTSVLLQRRGYHPRLIESMLGHSSLELTYGVYGGWSPENLAAEAARMPGSE